MKENINIRKRLFKYSKEMEMKKNIISHIKFLFILSVN